MSDLSTAASMAQIARGLPVIKFGFALLGKENKTEEEARAAKSFKRFFISTIIVVLVTLTAMGASAVASFGSDDADLLYETKRYGTVEGDSVWYIKNIKQYLSLEEFGLDEYNLQDGDRVVLFFNSPEDELIDAMPKSVYEDNENKVLSVLPIAMAIAVVVIVVFALVGRKIIGKDFYEFHKRCRMGEMDLQQ